MNKNLLFLLLLLIILITGIIIILYNYKNINQIINQTIKEFFEDTDLNNFTFDDKIYSQNIIINQNLSNTYNTNYFEIADFDLDGKILPDFDSDGKPLLNNVFTKFLISRLVLKDEYKKINEIKELGETNPIDKDFTNFKITNNITITFEKINTFLEIQFNGKNKTKILNFTIKSNTKGESINIDSNILNTGITKLSLVNIEKFIKSIEFVNISMKKDNKFSNIFYIKLNYSNSTNEIKVFQLPDDLADSLVDNHFCNNLFNVSVYSNPLNNITITNNFLVEIYLKNFEPIIKSMRTKVFDRVALTHNTGHIFRPHSDNLKYASLGDYMYDERPQDYKKVPAWKKALIGLGAGLLALVSFGAGIAVGIGASEALKAETNAKGDITYKKLRDALLLNTENEYVIFAERVGYSWDDDFINLRNKKRNTNSDIPNEISNKKRKDPLILFNLHPVKKLVKHLELDGTYSEKEYIYYPLGDYAYVGAIDNSLLATFRKFKKYTASNDYDFKEKLFNTIPHVLVREDCIDWGAPLVKHGPNMIWWDAGGPTPDSVDGSAGSYWVKNIHYNQAAINDADKKDSDNGGYKNSDVNNPGNFLALFYGAHNMGTNFSGSFGKERNYKIKEDCLKGQKRPSIIDRTTIITDAIKKKLNDTIKDYNITYPPINKSVSPYISQINKDKTDSLSIYTTNVDFNNKMKNIQKNYNHNFSYITEINTQLSEIRQKEKTFVENQIKQQLETNKTKIQDDIKKQTENLKKYDTDISQTSTTIGNQINEYVVLRKYRELMPTNPQIMY